MLRVVTFVMFVCAYPYVNNVTHYCTFMCDLVFFAKVASTYIVPSSHGIGIYLLCNIFSQETNMQWLASLTTIT